MQRELLLLREMRDAAVAIREVGADRSSEQLEADTLRRSALMLTDGTPVMTPEARSRRRDPFDDPLLGQTIRGSCTFHA